MRVKALVAAVVITLVAVARPVVTQAINRNLPAGRDYHGPPLPYGYLQTTEPWDEELLTQAESLADEVGRMLTVMHRRSRARSKAKSPR